MAVEAVDECLNSSTFRTAGSGGEARTSQQKFVCLHLPNLLQTGAMAHKHIAQGRRHQIHCCAIVIATDPQDF